MGDAFQRVLADCHHDKYCKPVTNCVLSPRASLLPKQLDAAFSSPANNVIKCTPCDQTFNNPDSHALNKHLATPKHQINSQWSPNEGVSKKDFFTISSLLRKHSFLAKVGHSTIRCTHCEKNFDLSQLSRVAPHIQAKHTLRAINNPARHVLREMSKNPECFTQHDNKLMCLQCKLQFCPRDPRHLCDTTKRHLASALHQKTVAKKAAKPANDGCISRFCAAHVNMWESTPQRLPSDEAHVLCCPQSAPLYEGVA